MEIPIPIFSDISDDFYDYFLQFQRREIGFVKIIGKSE